MEIDVRNPRQEIEEAIAAGNNEWLLKLTGLLHGHYCPYVALGVMAAARAMKDLGVRSSGMEQVVVIVETNNCFSDGVQMVTGCSFGNNALIYRDYGKTAFTLARRTGEAIRVSIKGEDSLLSKYAPPEALMLFQKVVTERQGTPEDGRRLMELWAETSFALIQARDEDVLTIQHLNIEVPSYAPMFDSITCPECGEQCMAPRGRSKDGKMVCLACSGEPYYELTGAGIDHIEP